MSPLITALTLLTLSNSILSFQLTKAANNDCTAICTPMSELASDCGYHNSADMTGRYGPAMMSCICQNSSFNVSLIGPLCASCFKEGGSGGMMSTSGGMMMNGANMDGIMSACKFTSTSYSPTATSLVAGIHVSASPVVTPSNSAAQNVAVREMAMHIPIAVAAAAAMWG